MTPSEETIRRRFGSFRTAIATALAVYVPQDQPTSNDSSLCKPLMNVSKSRATDVIL